MIDAVVFFPAAHGIVAGIAFDEALFGSHHVWLEGKGLRGSELSNLEILIVEQQAVCAKD